MSRIFDGANDCGTHEGVVVDATATETNPVGWCIWFKRGRTSHSFSESLMFSGPADAAQHYIAMLIETTNQLVCRSRTTSNANATSVGTVTDTNAWHLAVGKIVAGLPSVSLDGGAFVAASTTRDPVTATSRFRIGANLEASIGAEFQGKLEYPCAWEGVELTDQNAADLWNGGAGVDPRTVQGAFAKMFVPFAGNSPEVDQIGAFDLTFSGTTADADTPFSLSGTTQTVLPTGQGSSAVYGSHTFANVAAQTTAPSGKESAAVFGTHTIGAASPGQTITHTGLASAAVYGSHTLAQVAARTLAPSGIASAAVFGTHEIAESSGVPSAAVYGTHQIAETNIEIVVPPGKASAAVYGTHALANAAARVVQPEAGNSAVVYGGHTVSQGAVGTIAPSGIASASVVGVLIAGDVQLTIAPLGVASVRTGAHTILGGVPQPVLRDRHKAMRARRTLAMRVL